MTTGGPPYPSTPPQGNPGGAPHGYQGGSAAPHGYQGGPAAPPPTSYQGGPADGPPNTPPAGTPHPPVGAQPPSAGGGRTRSRTMMLALALVIGLVVGAGIVGGVWWANKPQPGAVPTPIPISLDTLPDQVLGQQRDDLALAALGKAKAKAQATKRAHLYTDQIDEYQDAYGGPGIMAGYGTVQGDQSYTLLIVNGIQPAPPVTPNSVLSYQRYLDNSDGIAAPGTETTQCVAAATAQGIVINDKTSVAQAKQKVLNGPQSLVTCVRSDRARNVSIELRGWRPGSDDGPPASSQASQMATEVDKIWESVVGG